MSTDRKIPWAHAAGEVNPPRLDEGSEREALKWCAAALQAVVDSRGERGSINMIVSGEKKSLEEVLDMADVALSTGRLGGEWLPIESAPKDGTLMLLCDIGWPHSLLRNEPPPMKVGGYWKGRWEIWGASWTPTHYMPLPPAPAAKPEGDKSHE